MGVVHIPRTAAAVARGYMKRRLSPLSDREKSLVGMGMTNPPHVYASRAGLFDVDIMIHMNNASYLTHAELARWEWSAFGGVLGASVRTNSYFIAAASVVRFRREIAPLKNFEIETRVVGMDDRNVWAYQTFHHAGTAADKNQRGKVLAQVLTQAVIKNDAKVVNPRSWAEEHLQVDKGTWDNLATTPDGSHSLFSEKSQRFVNLEETLRKSAALRDDGVTK